MITLQTSQCQALPGQLLAWEDIRQMLQNALAPVKPQLKKVLLLPPDYTRYYSGAGAIANWIYHDLEHTCQVDIMPALGTHLPMSDEELTSMYGDIPKDRFFVHNWRTEVVQVGMVPGQFVKEVSEGLMDEDIPVMVNRRLLEDYDLILSIGQVVPHEVVGMANHSKNIFVGCGGAQMINASHILGAFYGMERIMGKDFSPVRKVFDYAQEHFLSNLPLHYIMTVTTECQGKTQYHGVFLGRERQSFEQAVALAQQTNLTLVDKPFDKVVVYLDEQEFKSTWLGNKAVYRTRMAIKDGGELIILAPGVDKFGEDAENDKLIRKYGYCGRLKIVELCHTQEDLKQNLSAGAHLIHGSCDGRFTITYCTQHLTQQEVESVHYQYMPYAEALQQYPKDQLKDGYNTLPNGEEIFYISNPALGLWADKSRF